MTFQPLENAPSMYVRGRGSVMWNSILCGSAIVMSPTVANSGVRGITTPFGGRQMRSYVAFTSSAVKSAPSWNLTPLRR